MLISLCNEVLREYEFEEQCQLAAALGYDGLEIAPYTLGEVPWALPKARRAEMVRQAEGAGVKITGLHALLYTPKGLSITATYDGVWQETRSALYQLMDLAVDLGARIMVHGSPKARALLPGQAEAGRKRAIEMFAAVAPGAEERGLTYCIEALPPDETDFLHSIEEALAIVRQIDNPALQTMIDCSAVGHSEAISVAEMIARTLPTGHIRHVHFNDPNRRGPGEGDMVFGPILRALQAHGYQGDSALEPFRYIPNGLASAARCIGYLRGIEDALANG